MQDRPSGETLLDTPIGDMPERWLYVECAGCQRSTEYPLRLMASRLGKERILRTIIPRLRCEACGGKPASASVKENNSRDGKGVPHGWTVPLSIEQL